MRSPLPTLLLPAALIAAAAALAGCAANETAADAGPGDIVTLPAGRPVDLTAQAVPGKVTIYDFYADWCAPCRVLGPKLEELARARPSEVALRKVDVVNWESETAVHQNIEYLPYLAVVAADGTVAAEGDPAFEFVKQRFGVDLLAALLVM
jgi:thiol-disulfide isomerase/thioredoxin